MRNSEKNRYAPRYFELTSLSATHKGRYSTIYLSVSFIILLLFIKMCFIGSKTPHLSGEIQEDADLSELNLVHQQRALEQIYTFNYVYQCTCINQVTKAHQSQCYQIDQELTRNCYTANSNMVFGSKHSLFGPMSVHGLETC